MSAKCNLCESPIIWDQPYVKGSRPRNEDGSTHSCKKPDTLESFESKVTPTKKPSTSSTGITENALTSVSVLAECLAFKNMFFDVESDAKFDSIARIYISGRMRR